MSLRLIIRADAFDELLLKNQLGLFDKLVQVKGSVAKDGTVREAHTAIRHVKRPEPAKAHHPEVRDLFEAKPEPAAPEATQGRTMAEVRAAREAREAAEREAPPTPKMSAEDFKALVEKSKEQVAQRKSDAAAIADAPGAAKLAHRDGRKALVSPDLEKPGTWRVTRLDDQGPVGHTEHESKEAAAEEALRAGYAPPEVQNVAPIEAPASVSLYRGLDYSDGMPPAPDFGVQPGVTKAERRSINARAAAMVDGGDLVTPAEPIDPRVLRQYSGYGGCGDSLNEFYTDPAVAVGMWKALSNLGVAGPGMTALEPSCATGVFLAAAPAGVKVTGVELDGTSARIGAALHPNHEVVHSSLEKFATSDVRAFDAVIGNAPFGTRGACQIDDKRDLSLHEAYFMDTSLDKLRPGGVVAMIVNTTLMNSKNMRKIRERLIRKGEFLGAMRMPNSAFEAAHTDVTSDVLFFRKRPDDVAGALSVVDQDTLKKLGAWDEDFLSGRYFEERGADNVLGEVGTSMRAFGEIYAVTGSMAGVPEALAGFKVDSVSEGPKTVADVLAAAPEAMADRIRGAASTKPYDLAKRGDVKLIDGVRYILEGDPLRWHRVDEFAAQQAVVDAGEVSDAIERAIQGDHDADLAFKVRAYVEKHGLPSKNLNLQIAAKSDKRLYRLLGAVKPDGSLSDLVEGRNRDPVATSFDAAAQTLALEVGFFTPSMVAGRWHDGNEETVLDHLYASPDYALDPATQTWTSLDNYLTGELWPKLDEVVGALALDDGKPEDRAKYERQKALLDETIGAKALEDVEVQLNSAFLPLSAIEEWWNETQLHDWNRKETLSLTFDEGIYAATGGGYETKLLLKYLNRTGVRKDDDMPTIDRWNAAFKEWLCASSLRDEIEELYNRKFRGFRARAYSDAPFDIPGLTKEFEPKNYQWSGLRWALKAGKGIIAADVGLGKTLRALMLNKLLKATGRVRKPLIVVPLSVAANWMREAEKWFPGSSVLVIGETYSKDKKGNLKGRPDTAAERDRKYHDLTQNDYDFVLITQPAWNELDLDPETKKKYQDDDFWEQRKKSLESAKEKKINAARDKWDSKMVDSEFERKTGAIYFNDLGVDGVISDEMHAYKNLFEAKNRFGESPKFLGGSGSSKRAADMRWKSAFVRDNGGTIYGLTATPTKNSPLEVYSMLSHIAPEAFERIGIRNSEEFLDRYCVFEDRNILTTTGQMTSALCTTGFKNLDELREIMRRYIDRKTAEDVGLKLPEADNQQHLLDMSTEQREVYALLREQADQAALDKDAAASGEGHIFSIMSRMGKASLDLELYDPVKYKGAASPKLDAMAAKVAEGHKNGGQLVFCDHVDVHQKIADRLVASGIPRDQIGIINAQVAPSSAKRQNIAEAYRAGKLRVVIGNTATMGEGVDGLQENTRDIHHLDWPWEPATLQQRNGRGRRQGNKAESIGVHSYLGKGTFDGYRYQTVMAKKDWQSLLWSGGDRVENLAMAGQLSREDMLVMLADDPDAARKKLDENRELAQRKLDADKYGAAAEAFSGYRKKMASYTKMKPEDREKPAGARLKVQMDRTRTALEANAYFKPKHALDAKHDVLVQPQTGEAYEPGVAFEAAGDFAKVTPGRYVVVDTHTDPDGSGRVIVRPWGSTKIANKAFKLDDLANGVEPFKHDDAAEKAHIEKAVGDQLAANIGDLKHMRQLVEMPASAVQAHYDTIQKAVKSGMKGFTFAHDYGDIGMISPDGKPVAAESYGASKLLDTHDVMLPTEDHKAKAFDAFHEDQVASKWVRDYSNPTRGAGSRGGYYQGPTRMKLEYPKSAAGYGENGSNKWGGVIRRLWGPQAAEDAKKLSDDKQLEKLRAAPTMKEAIEHALPMTAHHHYQGMHSWSKPVLASLYQKAKETGALDAPFDSHTFIPDKLLPERAGYGLGRKPTREALALLAEHMGHKELGAAMRGGTAEVDRAA